MLHSNQLAIPTLYRGQWLDGDPITYNDVLIIYPSNCTQPTILGRFSVCDYSVVLVTEQSFHLLLISIVQVISDISLLGTETH